MGLGRSYRVALLDWLACEFMRTGWNTKTMHKLIVTSATYRQSSKVTPEKFARVFARCRELGLHVVAHAGENFG